MNTPKVAQTGFGIVGVNLRLEGLPAVKLPCGATAAKLRRGFSLAALLNLSP